MMEKKATKKDYIRLTEKLLADHTWAVNRTLEIKKLKVLLKEAREEQRLAYRERDRKIRAAVKRGVPQMFVANRLGVGKTAIHEVVHGRKARK